MKSTRAEEKRMPYNGLKTLPLGERPQERLERHGPGALSDTELLAMLIRSGSKGFDVLTLSQQLIREAKSLAGLLSWTVDDFKKIRGIGKVKALQLIAILEVARRILKSEMDYTPLLDSPESVFRFLSPMTVGLQIEKFFVLALNSKNKLIRCIEITSGTANSSLVHPREVFREAIKISASAIIAAHNHPSGDPAPSSADIKVTRLLREASKTVDIPILDHIIVGSIAQDPHGSGFYSFNESGFL